MLDTSMAAGPLPLFIAPIRTTAEKLSEIFAVVFLFTSKRLWVMQLSLSSDGCAITALGTKNTITAARATFISSPRSAPGGPGTQLGYTLTNGPPGEAAHQWSAKQGQGFLAGALHPSIPGGMGVTFNGPIKFFLQRPGPSGPAQARASSRSRCRGISRLALRRQPPAAGPIGLAL